MDDMIACQGVSKSFGDSPVLDHLDLEVPRGAVVTILGKSGSGKTTLLRLIAGFERPDGGTILIDDEIVDSARQMVPPERRRIGYVAQEGNLFPHLTVAKNVAFGLGRHERTSGRVEELLGLVGLADFAGRYPHQLSGGQQQRIALARALAPRPNVVLLDEPFSSLDAGLRAALRFDVMGILREVRATTVFVTHDQQEALSVADLVGIIDHGRIRQFASPETLYSCPVDPAVARFLGEANLVDGTASRGVVDTALGSLALSGESSEFTGPAIVLIRPEQVTLEALAGDRDGSRGATGRVVQREYYGHDCVVLVQVDDTADPLRVRCSGRSLACVGDLVVLSAAGIAMAWPAKPTGTVDDRQDL